MCKKSKFPLVFNIFLAFFITLVVTLFVQAGQGTLSVPTFVVGMIQGFCLNLTLETIIDLPAMGNTDESCHTRSNLKALKGRYEMVNIKLDKTGGLTEALALATEARAQGFSLMLGCMLCTSRAISAALPLVPQVSFADLDGPTWLAVDVEPALQFTTGELHL